eukprot:415653_1
MKPKSKRCRSTQRTTIDSSKQWLKYGTNATGMNKWRICYQNTSNTHPTPSATIQKVENSHHQSDVVVMVLDTKGGFRRCQWLLLVVLLMMGTTKLLMKGHL